MVNLGLNPRQAQPPTHSATLCSAAGLLLLSISEIEPGIILWGLVAMIFPSPTVSPSTLVRQWPHRPRVSPLSLTILQSLSCSPDKTTCSEQAWMPGTNPTVLTVAHQALGGLSHQPTSRPRLFHSAPATPASLFLKHTVMS